jgi:dihydroorotate dehydrogenase
MRLYRLLFGLLERAGVDGERAHALAGDLLRATMAVPGTRALAGRLLAPRDPRLRVQALGRSFPSPLGLAAGVDSSAGLFAEFGALGFGFVEVGTVTALPQEGNEGKRVFRLLADRAILNRRGFPNAGAEVAARRLAWGGGEKRTGVTARRSPGTSAGAPIVGVNIGKSRAVALEDAERDYRASARALAPFADYLALNVSSPNTPGLREMQSTGRLRALVGAVREELAAAGLRVPLLVKIAPDMSDAQLREIAELALELELDGIVAVNTTVDRGVLNTPGALPTGVPDGGISGAPLAARSLEVLRLLRAVVGERVTLISVGGIETARDAWERLLAGATLVQAHTAFVYGGPLWPSRLNRELARLVRAADAANVGELVGELAPAPGTAVSAEGR